MGAPFLAANKYSVSKKLGFICMFAFMYFSFSSERKVPKEAPPKEETKVSPFGNPLPYMVAHAVQKHRVNCARSDLHQDCRVVGKRADQLGRAENARDGKVFAPRGEKLQIPFWGKPNQDKPTVLKTPAHYTPAVTVRVGRHACRQLGTMGIGVYGAQSSWRSHGAHHQGKGFSRETVGFLLNGVSFGTFLPLVGEKYIKNKHQTDR